MPDIDDTIQEIKWVVTTRNKGIEGAHA